MIRCLNPREEELPEREKASHDRSNAYIVTKSPDRVLPPDRRVLPTDYLHGLYIELGGHQTIGTYSLHYTQFQYLLPSFTNIISQNTSERPSESRLMQDPESLVT